MLWSRSISYRMETFDLGPGTDRLRAFCIVDTWRAGSSSASLFAMETSGSTILDEPQNPPNRVRIPFGRYLAVKCAETQLESASSKLGSRPDSRYDAIAWPALQPLSRAAVIPSPVTGSTTPAASPQVNKPEPVTPTCKPEKVSSGSNDCAYAMQVNRRRGCSRPRLICGQLGILLVGELHLLPSIGLHPHEPTVSRSRCGPPLYREMK